MLNYLRHQWICYALIGLAAMTVWGSSVRFDFVWDDSAYITGNEGIRSLKNIPRFFYRNDSWVPGKPSLVYRPVRNTVFAVLTALGGKTEPQPWIYHSANVLGHALAAMLLFTVALLLFQQFNPERAMVAAFLVALGFAVHPVVSEVVCWAKCLDDILTGIFVLASVRSMLKWQEGRSLVPAVIWFALAVFSKESAVPFAAVAVFILRGFHKLAWRRSVFMGLPFFATALVYAVCQHFVAGRTSQCAPISGTYLQTLIDTVPMAQKYLRLLWGVPPFTADYNYLICEPPRSVLSQPVLIGLLLIISFAGIAIWLWRFENWRVVAFGIIWIALFMLPVSNLIPMMQYIAERFLYLPLIGFLLALGAAGLHCRRCIAVGVAAAGILIIWTANALQRLPVWHDEVNLFVQASLAHPKSWRLRENSVISIFALPQLQPFFRLDDTNRQLQVKPPSRGADAALAIRTLVRAHDLLPGEYRFTAALGIAYAETGRISKAIPWLELAAHQTNDVHCWIDLSTAYMSVTNIAKARDAIETALRLDPANAAAQARLRELDAMRR